MKMADTAVLLDGLHFGEGPRGTMGVYGSAIFMRMP